MDFSILQQTYSDKTTSSTLKNILLTQSLPEISNQIRDASSLLGYFILGVQGQSKTPIKSITLSNDLIHHPLLTLDIILFLTTARYQGLINT